MRTKRWILTVTVYFILQNLFCELQWKLGLPHFLFTLQIKIWTTILFRFLNFLFWYFRAPLSYRIIGILCKIISQFLSVVINLTCKPRNAELLSNGLISFSLRVVRPQGISKIALSRTFVRPRLHYHMKGANGSVISSYPCFPANNATGVCLLCAGNLATLETKRVTNLIYTT